MKKPEIPADEEERLEALCELGVLDAPAEERFDRFTRIARRLFGVPIALVSLVDAERQWFKSKQGLGAAQTGRDISFCGHAILGPEVFVVEDATQDDRFFDNPLVVGDPLIRFYAGYPLIGPRGHRMGTLCIIDTNPRTFADEDRVALCDVGAMVENELSALHLATLDELTGISNRRGLDMLSQQALAACRRTATPAVVVLVDLDGFKDINDQHGHQTGDRALIEFADLMVSTFRESDAIARLGGDEFCALLTGATATEAQIAIRRLRKAADDRSSGKPYRLRFSAGVAEYAPGSPPDLAALIAQADSAMYGEKRRSKHTRSGQPPYPFGG